ncbi:MAG: aminopeptidase P family protein [Oscillospiraceae bacterium]
MENRVERLIEQLGTEFEAALITSEENRFYLFGMHSSAGTAVILKDKSYFIIDSRYIELAKKTVKNAEIILQTRVYQQVNELLKKHDVHTVWLEESVNLGTYGGLEKILCDVELPLKTPLTRAINDLRAIKSIEELKCIETAQEFTDAGFRHICNLLSAGQKERDMAIELEHFMKKQGAQGLAFDTILVSGENSSLPHGVPGDKRIANGDFITMDFGARFGGYCTDMTRTVAIGRVSQEMREVYDTVLTAQQRALDAIKAGAVCGEVDSCARDYINQRYSGMFGHGLGHSVGIEIHEYPRFSPGSTTVLQEGMVMTVEPGVYLPGKFGVRIEDTVYVTKDGLINVAKSPKELIAL